MIIPAIDLIDGKVVRLFQGDYTKQTDFDICPLSQLKKYQQQGAKWLHIVDLTGAKDPDKRQTTLLTELAQELDAKVQVGGGIRDEAQIEGLLSAGVSRVVIGSLAVKQPELVASWITKYGAEAICLALDVNITSDNKKVVAVSGWQTAGGKTLESLVEYFKDFGLAHALVTDISRDGTMQGANTNLYAELAAEFPYINWQGSGGISSLKDVAAVKTAGASSIIIGKALLTNQFSVRNAIDTWESA